MLAALSGSIVVGSFVKALVAALGLGGGALLLLANGGGDMHWVEMGMGLFGGLALFLFGMEQMSEGLKAAAGERMKDILEKLTRNRVSAALTGALVTAVIQSSSVTTVLVVGFVSAGLMSFTQCIGVIMGANVGTTVTAQIVAFKVEEAALALVAVGFAMLFLARRDRMKQYGTIVMGLGLVFYGMGVMSEAMTPLRSYQPFLDLMAHMTNPLIGILVAMAFTALVQSSSATTGIVIVMASQGFVSLPAGIALGFGANVGTCVTALLASLGKSREALRASMVHVLFNVFGVVVWILFIDQLAAWSVGLSPSHPELSGIERLAAETPRQIANANTLFNVANTVIFLGLASVLARAVRWLVPDRPVTAKEIIRPQFLDRELLGTPALALERVRFELGRLGGITVEMLKRVRPALLDRDQQKLEEIARMDDQVDLLDRYILDYLGNIQRGELTTEQGDEFQNYMKATTFLESIGDVVETGFVKLGGEVIRQKMQLGATERHLLEDLYQATVRALESAVTAVGKQDQRAAQDVVTMKASYTGQVDEAYHFQAERLAVSAPELAERIRAETEIVDLLRRIYSLSKRLARTVLPRELATAE